MEEPPIFENKSGTIIVIILALLLSLPLLLIPLPLIIIGALMWLVFRKVSNATVKYSMLAGLLIAGILVLIFWFSAIFSMFSAVPMSGQATAANNVTMRTGEVLERPAVQLVQDQGIRQESDRVVGMVDGDTIRVEIGEAEQVVRLIGIDTPELRDPRQPVQCFAQEASNRARELMLGKLVILQPDPWSDDRDRYGRLLRYVYLQDGTLVNREMIEGGYAFEYTYQNRAYQFRNEFTEAENEAREQGRGLWSDETCGGDTGRLSVPEERTRDSWVDKIIDFLLRIIFS